MERWKGKGRENEGKGEATQRGGCELRCGEVETGQHGEGPEGRQSRLGVLGVGCWGNI